VPFAQQTSMSTSVAWVAMTAVPSVVWTGYDNMTIQAGNPGYFLVTNSTCTAAGCSVMVSSWGWAGAAEPRGRWLYDDRNRLRPLHNIQLCLQYGTAGGLVRLQGCDDSLTTQRWTNVGEYHKQPHCCEHTVLAIPNLMFMPSCCCVLLHACWRQLIEQSWT
jgi:hypothetical protein